ncbi:MAG: gamma-glutamylcyclotransferase family protein [Methanobacteriaceae archaeon]|nr:gamma-glutamylcyclotransferase family protein [Methanobacteriaceae archaeon]
MTDIILNRYDQPEFDQLYAIIGGIENFLDEDFDIDGVDWNRNLDAILDFQDADGSFKLISSFRIPSDARVDFCYVPTYICTAILMKTYLIGDSALTGKVEQPLIRALDICCGRKLRGHGYDGFKGQIEALNIFIKGGLREFIDLHPDLNPKFTRLILNIQSQFEFLEAKEDFIGGWGENYKEDILRINRYFSTRNVFVYGTLMNGESNHYFLNGSTFLRTATIDGYELYNVGWFPAIIPAEANDSSNSYGEGRVIGELYEVPTKDMPSIDRLEGEGSLYIRKCKITEGFCHEKSLAYVYEYAQDVTGLEKINSWKEYVWYVSYGSNMLYERFLCYIEGGAFEEGGSYNEPCEDTSAPLEVRTLEIPYDMYFGNESGSWNGCGVSFLDTTKKGKALGVAYLITREQFEHVAAWENSGRFPDGYGSWYENIKTFGELDGFDLVTVTNDDLRPYNEPCEEYLRTLARGIKQNWPEMSDEDINNYLDSCIRE